MATVFETIEDRHETIPDGEDILSILDILNDASSATFTIEDISTEEASGSLPRDKQLELFYRTKEGDTDAAEELIRSVTNLAYFINRRTGSRFSDDEALELGYFGIAKAFDSFDPNRKVLFSTHAGNHIRWALLNEISKRKRRLC